jgi:hypothetical protein
VSVKCVLKQETEIKMLIDGINGAQNWHDVSSPHEQILFLSLSAGQIGVRLIYILSVSWAYLTTKIITLSEFYWWAELISPLKSSHFHPVSWAYLTTKIITLSSVSWAYLTTKIITLSEFLNFVCEVSRLQYEWLSDCWCIWKSFGVNACLQWRNVFSFHWKSVGELSLSQH